MAKFKPPKRLFRGQDVIHSYQPRRVEPAARPRAAVSHPDGLQHVEFAFATLAMKDPKIDDLSVIEAVQMSLKGSAPDESTDPRVAKLCTLIGSVRATRENVSDFAWFTGLRSVAESIRNHSGLAPGQKDYLDFIHRYVS